MKLLKDILAKKRRINKYLMVALTHVTSDVLKNGVPEKMNDLGSFMVSYSIADVDLGRVLCDLEQVST